MNKNKGSKKRRYARRKTSKPSKSLTRAVKQIVKKNIETKTINVENPVVGGVNSIFVPYGALSGVQYMAEDVFSVKQGVTDSSAIGALNRIGDKIRGVGFLMDYYIHTANNYQLNGIFYPVPFVKVRITAWRQAFGVPLLNQALLYDGNFLNTNTSTLQPINWDEGYVKDVLYDKVFIIKNNYFGIVPTSSFTNPLYGNVLHFKKYIKYDKPIKFADNNSTNPNSTDNPVYVTISAEVDDSNTGLVPSGAKILWTTGYTRAWFKDA